MQDEVNEKTVSICIRGGKISAEVLKNALTKVLAEVGHTERREGVDWERKRVSYHGKQSMEKLKGSNCELSSIEVTDGNIKSFERYARKYSVDYCLKKDVSTDPPKHYVFFRAKDVDSMTAAFKEYTGWQLGKSGRQSVRGKLSLAVQRAARHRELEKTKKKERDAQL